MTEKFLGCLEHLVTDCPAMNESAQNDSTVQGQKTVAELTGF
jgi:hypothetical protein